MTNDFQELKSYLVNLGLNKFPKNRRAFRYHIDHLVGVYTSFEKYGCPKHLGIAGLFHSVYSTDEFIGFSLGLDRRMEIQNLIGEATEKIVYNYCAVTGQSLFTSTIKGSFALWDRFTKKPLVISEEDFNSLLWLKLVNALELDGRCMKQSFPSYRKLSNILWWRIVAERLGHTAINAWNQVYGEQIKHVPYGKRPLSAFNIFPKLFGLRSIGER